MTTILSIDAIATDADLFAEASESICARALPAGETTYEKYRTQALDDVLAVLRSRRPPIFDTDLSDPSELKRAVVFRSLERLFRNAVTVAGDAWHLRADTYRREYAAELAGLSPTVQGGAIGPARSISIVRR